MMQSPFGVYYQKVRYYFVLLLLAPLVMRTALLVNTPANEWTLGQGIRILLLGTLQDIVIAMGITLVMAAFVLTSLRTRWSKTNLLLARVAVTAGTLYILSVFYRQWQNGLPFNIDALWPPHWSAWLIIPLTLLVSSVSLRNRNPIRLYNVSAQRLLVGTGHVWLLHALLAAVLIGGWFMSHPWSRYITDTPLNRMTVNPLAALWVHSTTEPVNEAQPAPVMTPPDISAAPVVPPVSVPASAPVTPSEPVSTPAAPTVAPATPDVVAPTAPESSAPAPVSSSPAENITLPAPLPAPMFAPSIPLIPSTPMPTPAVPLTPPTPVPAVAPKVEAPKEAVRPSKRPAPTPAPRKQVEETEKKQPKKERSSEERRPVKRPSSDEALPKSGIMRNGVVVPIE